MHRFIAVFAALSILLGCAQVQMPEGPSPETARTGAKHERCAAVAEEVTEDARDGNIENMAKYGALGAGLTAALVVVPWLAMGVFAWTDGVQQFVKLVGVGGVAGAGVGAITGKRLQEVYDIAYTTCIKKK